jgi:lantibiotic modifying enzyme
MTSQPTVTGDDTASLGPAWWAPGLALHERSAGTVRDVEGPLAGPARERVARWRASHRSGDWFDRRLAATGIDEAALLALLVEPAERLAARTVRPAWAEAAERAIRYAAPPGRIDRPATWEQVYALAVHPFTREATARLTERVTGTVDPAAVDLPGVTAQFATRLAGHLAGLAARTLAHELDVPAGQAEPAARTWERVSTGVRRLLGPEGLAGLLRRYPVLARLLGQAGLLATEATAELLTRFAADRPAIVAGLLGGVDPGVLVSVSTGLGDTHAGGRSVAVLTFADGHRVVYKPRDLTVHTRFSTMLRWLDRVTGDLDLSTVATVDRPGYGWMEHVPHLPLADLDAADLFHRRQGAQLALLHAVRATDIHGGNVIARGDQPLLVDVETLFHPPLAGAEARDPAARALAASVQRIGLLPVTAVGRDGPHDLSGIGAEHGTNRPRLGDKDIDPTDHEPALLDGFRHAYDAIVRHRAEFTDLLRDCSDIQVRVVVRHTRGYLTLLADSTRPELLRDALDRDRAFDLLWAESAHDPVRWRTARQEVVDLWAHDVPLFCVRPGSTDVWGSTGQRLAGLLDRPSLEVALDTVRRMGETDRGDQEWVLCAAMATRRPTDGHHRVLATQGPLAGTAALPERLLAAACALADQIVARGVVDGDRVNWLGLQLLDDRRWMVLPMGADLADGYVGVALFLAQLCRTSGIARYGEVARQAVTPLAALYAALAGQPAAVAAIGRGARHGFGGIAYGLARLSTLLSDDDVWRLTRTTVGLAAVAGGQRHDPDPDQPADDAGCLAAMCAVHTELGLPEAAALADVCADRLVGAVARLDGPGRAAVPAGFAGGTAGVGWALGRYAATAPADRHRYAAAAGVALRRAATAAQHRDATRDRDTGHPWAPALGWCQGLAGLVLATGDLPGQVAESLVAGWTDRLSADRALLRDLSLCHGELGIAEALTVPGPDGRSRCPAAARRRRAGLILDAVNQHGPGCGTPGGVPTPGLMTGLAGIGYGLLRLGFADRVPSVLLFEPTPAP